MTRQSLLLAQCLVALGLGFALLALPIVHVAFDALSLALAWCGEHILRALGQDVARHATELRETPTGFAVEVTRACDGSGIVVSWAAVAAILPGNLRRKVVGFVLGVLAIQLFNLIRVAVLFLALPSGSALFDTAHYFVFPLLTSVLLIGFAAAVCPALRRPALLGCGSLLPLAAMWHLLAEPLSAALLVPAAQALLAHAGMPEVGTIAVREIGWSIGSLLPESLDPLRFYVAPLYPADFALALPVLAATVFAVRGGWVYLGLALAGMALALAVGAVTEIWGLATELDLVAIAQPATEGQLLLAAYDPPSPTVVARLRVLQNVVVHLNLLVLPVLILSRGRAQ